MMLFLKARSRTDVTYLQSSWSEVVFVLAHEDMRIIVLMNDPRTCNLPNKAGNCEEVTDLVCPRGRAGVIQSITGSIERVLNKTLLMSLKDTLCY